MDNNCRNQNNQYYRGRGQGPCQTIDHCNRRRNCECGRINDALEGMPLAMAYVPWQHWKDTYEPCKALNIGTIFPELNLPFMERSCGR